MNICRFETIDALSLWNTGKKLEKGTFYAYHVIELSTVSIVLIVTTRRAHA